MGEKEQKKKKRKSSPICFRNISINYERKRGTYQKGGANSNFQIFESTPFQNIFEAGLLLKEATQLAWASWAATSSPFFL